MLAWIISCEYCCMRKTQKFLFGDLFENSVYCDACKRTHVDNSIFSECTIGYPFNIYMLYIYVRKFKFCLYYAGRDFDP